MTVSPRGHERYAGNRDDERSTWRRLRRHHDGLGTAGFDQVAVLGSDLDVTNHLDNSSLGRMDLEEFSERRGVFDGKHVANAISHFMPVQPFHVRQLLECCPSLIGVGLKSREIDRCEARGINPESAAKWR